MINPEGAVLAQVEVRLAEPTDGFNATYNGLALDPNFLLPADMAINFTLTSGKAADFVRGDIDPGEWESTSAFKYPLMTLYPDGFADIGKQRFTEFSGPVKICINVFITFRQGAAQSDFNNVGNCVCAAMIKTFNRFRADHDEDQDWTSDIAYGGDIAGKRGPIKKWGENWFQQISFTMTFDVNQES